MSAKEHTYTVNLNWTGNLGEGTKKYTGYSRDHEIQANGKPLILGSSDPSFRGDPTRYNPEDLFVSTLSSCHMLWFLHLCTVNKITVVAYEDNPKGIMIEDEKGSGRFKTVTLFPSVVIKEKEKVALANQLHHQAHEYCFIANSVNFEVACEASTKIEEHVD